MCQFHSNMNTEGWLCRLTVTSSVTSSAWELFFMHNLHMVFPFLLVNWSYIEQVKFLKSEDILRSRQTFSSRVSPEGSYVNLIAKSIPWILSFWSTFYLKKIAELGQFQNLAYFFTWWPSFVTYFCVTYLQEPVTQYTCIPSLVMIRQSVRELCFKNVQTNRQADRRTDRQTDRQTDKRTYLPNNFGK